VTDETYSFEGKQMPSLKVNSFWRYLGMDFADSRLGEFNYESFETALGRISEKILAGVTRTVEKDRLKQRYAGSLHASVDGSELKL